MGANEKNLTARGRGLPLAAIAVIFTLALVPLASGTTTDHFSRSITISADRSSGTFSGRVHSNRPGLCAEGARVYVLQKRKGSDKRLAAAFAHTNDARWEVKLGGQGGHRIYAKVRRTVITGNASRTVCRGAVSAVIAG